MTVQIAKLRSAKSWPDLIGSGESINYASTFLRHQMDLKASQPSVSELYAVFLDSANRNGDRGTF